VFIEDNIKALNSWSDLLERAIAERAKQQTKPKKERKKR
jgi:hypothetical protein